MTHTNDSLTDFAGCGQVKNGKRSFGSTTSSVARRESLSRTTISSNRNQIERN